MFLAPLRSGSRQSPDMGDLMATNVLVSLPQTRGLASSWQQPCAKPSLPWELWISPGYRDSAQRQWRGMPGGGVCGGTTTLSQRGPSGREGGGQIYSLCLPQSLLGSLLVPPDLPRTSLLAPAPVLSMEVLFSSTRALSHPPDLLQEPPPSLLPILTQAAPHRGRQSDTHQAGVLPAAPGTAR